MQSSTDTPGTSTAGELLTCAAGDLCRAPAAADLSASTHRCNTCGVSIHCELWCGKSFQVLLEEEPPSVIRSDLLPTHGRRVFSEQRQIMLSDENEMLCHPSGIITDEDVQDRLGNKIMCHACIRNHFTRPAVPDLPALNHADTASTNDGIDVGNDSEGKKEKAASEKKEKRKLDAAEKRAQKAEASRQEKIRKLEYILGVPATNVVLNESGDDILCVGNVEWEGIGLEDRKAFLKHHQVSFGRTRNKNDLGKVYAQHLKAIPYKNEIAKNRRGGSNAKGGKADGTGIRVAKSTTRPTFVTKDGTFYRWINVITSQTGQIRYMATKNACDASMLDQGTAHPVDWEDLTRIYNESPPTEGERDVNHEIDCVSEFPETSGYMLDPMLASDCDTNLSISQIRTLSAYLEGTYSAACHKQKESGTHQFFENCVNGKKWLVYMRCKFNASGNKNLHECVFAECSEYVRNESSSGGSGGRGGRSPVPPGSGRKNAAASAIQCAAEQIDTRMGDLNRAENYAFWMKLGNQLITLETEVADTDSNLLAMKTKRKRDGESEEDHANYKLLKKKRKRLIKQIEMTKAEIERVEKLLGHENKEEEEESSSSSSSSSDEDD